jgi:hypothetical protein
MGKGIAVFTPIITDNVNYLNYAFVERGGPRSLLSSGVAAVA